MKNFTDDEVKERVIVQGDGPLRGTFFIMGMEAPVVAGEVFSYSGSGETYLLEAVSVEEVPSPRKFRVVIKEPAGR